MLPTWPNDTPFRRKDCSENEGLPNGDASPGDENLKPGDERRPSPHVSATLPNISAMKLVFLALLKVGIKTKIGKHLQSQKMRGSVRMCCQILVCVPTKAPWERPRIKNCTVARALRTP